MKKRINLKVELAIFAIISLIVGTLVSIFFKDSNIHIIDKTKEQKIKYVYEPGIIYIKNSLKKLDINNKNNYEEINKLLDYRLLYNFYIVNKKGEIIASNKKGVKTIDEKCIQDGERKVYTLAYNKNVSEVTACDYIKDGYYLYFTYTGYTKSDSYMMVNIAIIFIINFTLLTLGRIRYILNIKRSIKIIAQGDLSYRIPLKYNNELTELAENVNFMASELQKEDEKRKEFLTNISHDLRTPLTTTLGYLNMINEGKYDDEGELRSYIDNINKKSLFLKSMLDDFFHYSKLNSKDMQVSRENICVQELIRQIVEEEEIIFKQNRLELVLEFEEEPVNIKGDGELLVRAVENILSNALKYSRENTMVNVKVYKEKIEHQVYAVIAISNIPKEFIDEKELERFFERLYKKDKSRNQNGSGLGISIVEEILKIHNGFLKGSKDNERVIFRLFIKI